MDTRYTISMYRELCSKLDPDNPETIKMVDEFTQNVMDHRFDDEETEYTAISISSDIIEALAAMMKVETIEEVREVERSKDYKKLLKFLIDGGFYEEVSRFIEYGE